MTIPRTEADFRALLESCDGALAARLADEAVAVRRSVYGDRVFVRGLLEITDICRNDCLYCGIRRSNLKCERYRLDPDVIVASASHAYGLGFRTVVMQGGEDPYFTDEVLSGVIRRIKADSPGIAVTLSMGERTYDSYSRLFDAGADRYLLRHETADPVHYAKLHPAEMSFQNRMRCLEDLRRIGYQVGCGFMVGSPWQTAGTIAKDLKFIADFKPDMCGIGPFVPHRDTPFRDFPRGTVELTCLLLSIVRLIHPPVLLPATTALGTIDPAGREKGILAGANVVMPNLTPLSERGKYELYDGKLSTGAESAEVLKDLAARIESAGCRLDFSRGDAPR